MTLWVRRITLEEDEVLEQWQRSTDAVRYRRARIVRLSADSHKSAAIAPQLGLHVDTVRQAIKIFNAEGLAGLTPRPRSGGRKPRYTAEVVATAETCARQHPPPALGRATWTLQHLAEEVAAQCDHIAHISLERVRQWLRHAGLTYRRAKAWLTSPDPQYVRRKRQRDRLLRLARQDPDGAAVWLDESWFVRWPYRFWAWTPAEAKPRVPQRWNEEVETTALYAALDDDSQEAVLHWAAGQPNSAETVTFLEALMTYWAQRDKRFIALFWDKASWHLSHRTRQWIREYNQRAKQDHLPRLLVCVHPTRSPWLMPLEPVFGWVKHHVLGDRRFDTVPDLQAAVEEGFRQRVAAAKQRRDQTWSKSLATTP